MIFRPSLGWEVHLCRGISRHQDVFIESPASKNFVYTGVTALEVMPSDPEFGLTFWCPSWDFS